jgi:hypothetical protein
MNLFSVYSVLDIDDVVNEMFYLDGIGIILNFESGREENIVSDSFGLKNIRILVTYLAFD